VVEPKDILQTSKRSTVEAPKGAIDKD